MLITHNEEIENLNLLKIARGTAIICLANRVEPDSVARGCVKHCCRCDEFFKLLIELNSDDNGFATGKHAKTLVFCGTKRYCAQLARDMSKEGYSSQALHGDMEQHERDHGLLRFRQNKCKFLVATDVAARGLDVTDIE